MIVDLEALTAWLRERADRATPLIIAATYDGLRTRLERGDFATAAQTACAAAPREDDPTP